MILSGATILLPQACLAVGSVAVFLAGAAWRRAPSRLLFSLSLASLLACGLSAALVPGAGDYPGMLDGDGYGRYFTMLIAAVAFLALLFGSRYAGLRGIAGDEYYGLVLVAALGMQLLSCALHWAVFFLALELLSLPLYVLIASRLGDPLSGEAGLKYFILGSVASAFALFGVALLYCATGTLSIPASLSAAPAQAGGLSLLGLAMILTGLGFKVSLVPFHLWTADVYQGAPAPVAAFLSAGSKTAVFAALLRLMLLLPPGGLVSFLEPALWALAAATMLVGNIAALTQPRLKRLLAYSSIGQMGYVLMASLAARQDGARAVLFYLLVYALADLGAFGAVGLLSQSRSGEGDAEALPDYQGLASRAPVLAALLALCLLTLAGLPPTGGFVGKFALFRAAYGAGYPVLATTGLVAAIISVYFYLKVIVAMYMQPAETAAPASRPGLPAVLAGGAVFLLLLWLGLLPAGFMRAAAVALAAG